MNTSERLAPGARERGIAARAWAQGWALSRGTAAPVPGAGHLRIRVDKPGQTQRYVLADLDRALLQALVAGEAGPGTWLKVCAPVERVAPLLTGDWTLHEPEYLMGTDLVDGGLPVTAGYRLERESRGALLFARLVTDTGELAASGQAAVDGPFATFDQIVTAEAHRRKGLGRAIMAALSQAALARGARQGVLVATEAGAALYTTLGWSMVSPMTAASRA